MKKTLELLVLGALIVPVLACPRQVAVESEPARYQAAAEMDLTGTYAYDVDVEGQAISGDIVVRRSAGGGYSVAISSDMAASRGRPAEIGTSNVRRDGNTLTMDVQPPNASGQLELIWQSRDVVTGLYYQGGVVYELEARRRP